MNKEDNSNKLSVIMPALNEELNISDAISSTLEGLDFFKINGEIIIINDGSSDRTQFLIEQKSKENPGRIQLIKHDKPQGIGASFWEGVDYATGDFVIMLPGDNENDPREALRYYRLLEHVDMVIPFIFNPETRPFFRNALSFLYRFIINTTFLVNFHYTNGTVLYKKSILKELNYHSSSFFFQADILIRSVKKGYLFAEVPYKLGMRKKGVSKAVTFPSLYQVSKGYLRLVKDYYFSRDKGQTGIFSSDSLTAIRRQNASGESTDNN
ncbi:MAG: glycosyltransferase family 2 protein [Candidatus Omnitrophota bacterium]|nr:glycosyltransferase family 2 protein [Candidatus Omnitrophota bacterium]